MDITFKRGFLEHWAAYFPGAELPIVFSYTDEEVLGDATTSGNRSYCLVCDLEAVREGAVRAFNARTVNCGGARRYLGFETELRPSFRHFLSCGLPGVTKGERYKRSPELVDRYLESQPSFEAPDCTIVFKRWDCLEEADSPEVVVFFATPDVLSGLFTLANFDEPDPQAVIAPFASGCSSIVYHPYRELQAERPRAVMGMFDVSARPCVPPNVLTLAVPWPKFAGMVEQVEESFLITPSWRKVRARV